MTFTSIPSLLVSDNMYTVHKKLKKSTNSRNWQLVMGQVFKSWVSGFGSGLGGGEEGVILSSNKNITDNTSVK